MPIYTCTRNTACWTAPAASSGWWQRAKALGQKAVAITDHGVMYGVVDFYKAAQKARASSPSSAARSMWPPRTRFDKVHELDGENRHLVLLCENETGYHNLI